MIVGTAGHIDHGKTTLVRALTGVDTDRLPEEKARGISIELGYAFLDAGTHTGAHTVPRIGFIDVPGHERLVHTMLSGATGIDLGLLLVAADDGVMPQTREHLALLDLLGLDSLAVVITKCDRADEPRQAEVRADVQALLAPTDFAGARVFSVAAPSGMGVSALRDWLCAQAQAWAAGQAARASAGEAGFRLAVDRAFTLDGVGTVLTGTVFSGSVRLGDELVLAPQAAGPAQRLSMAPRWRVRSLHAQNAKVEQAGSGQRCAVALAGLARDQVRRGQWLVSPEVALQTDRIDVELRLWHEELRPLRSGTRVHLHLGSAQVMASVAVLAIDVDGGRTLADQLAPGAQGLVQLVLSQPVGAWWGDRLVLRDAAASRAVAGGRVLDPFAPVRYRRTPARLAELQALGRPSLAERLTAALAAAPGGLDLGRLAAAQGAALPALPADVLQARDGTSHGALGAQQTADLERAVLDGLAGFHRQHPEESGPDLARLRRLVAPRLPEGLWRALVQRLQQSGALVQRGAFLHLPEHAVQLSATEQRIAQKLAPLLSEAGAEGAWVRDLARDMHEPEALTRTTLARLAQQGELHQVVRDLYYPAAQMQRLVGLAVGIGRQQVERGDLAEVTAAAFRDATGLGRKRAIQILEHLDRVGVLRRVGDIHRLRPDSTLVREVAHG